MATNYDPPPDAKPKPRRSLRETPQPWRSFKSTDAVAFNLGAEQQFIRWLTKEIRGEPLRSVAVGWVIGNAAFHLDISPATVKRYIQKYTADLAPFYILAGNIYSRKDEAPTQEE